MKMPFKKKSAGSVDIQIELERLHQKLADYEQKRAGIAKALAEAQAVRRNVLSEDDAVVDQASAKVRKAWVEAEDMEYLVAEYRSAISDAQERLNKATRAEQVEAAAASLEAIAEKMDQQAPAIEKAAAAVAAAVKSMMTVMPADMAVFPTFNTIRPGDRTEKQRAYASAREAAAAIVAEALLNAVPEIFDLYFDSGDLRVGGAPSGYRASLARIMDPADPQPSYAGETADFAGLAPAAAIAALVSNRARENARRIRDGEIEPDITTMKPVRNEPALSLVSEEVQEAFRATG